MILAVAASLTLPISPAQDTVRISANGPPAWGANFRLVEEWQVGKQDFFDGDGFGYVTSLAVDARGIVWITDLHGPTLQRFSSQGEYLGSVGRVGGGPGEYGSSPASQSVCTPFVRSFKAVRMVACTSAPPIPT